MKRVRSHVQVPWGQTCLAGYADDDEKHTTDNMNGNDDGD